MYDDLPDIDDLHRGMPALDLANAFVAQAMGRATDEEKEQFVSTILCAGEHINEVSGPGEWEAFDAKIWGPQMPARNDKELAAFFFHIASFFGWMATCSLMTASSTSAILREIEAVGPACDARSGLTKMTLELLSTVPSA